MFTRRNFLKTTGSALAGAGSLGALSSLAEASGRGRAGRAPLNILVLGGTGFIGPHLVRLAVSRGHKVSIFTRGRRDADLPASVERLIGARTINDTIPQGNLKALEGRKWDVVFDDSATDPRWVRQSTALLKDSGRYLFVSSTGVYLPYRTPNPDETLPVVLEPENSTEYGIRKAQSEQVVLRAFGEKGTVIRPGYIVGPGDTTDRFSYWPVRFSKGGRILVPGKQSDPAQFVDVRDLVAFMIKVVEEQKGGTFNVTGPAERLSFGKFIAETKAAIRPDAEVVWIDDYDFLRKHQLLYSVPWLLPEGDNEHHMQINNKKAIAAGLTFRPIAETVKDTLADWPKRLALLPAGQQPNFRWMTPEKEQELLKLWEEYKKQ